MNYASPSISIVSWDDFYRSQKKKKGEKFITWEDNDESGW
jgi:hypothetical protein